MMYSVMAGGSALAIYFTQLLWDNVQLILFNYQTYVFWYVIVTGFISFVICYRFGPPKNQRSKNLIKWGLQMVSMGMIYFSSQFQEASVGVILLTIGIYYFPVEWLHTARKYWYVKHSTLIFHSLLPFFTHSKFRCVHSQATPFSTKASTFDQ